MLLISKNGIIMHPVVEEDVIEIINIADAPLLRESAELVLVYKDFFVLAMI